MATLDDDFGTLFGDNGNDDDLDDLFGEAGQGAEKMVAGIRPMADQARQDAYRRADELVAAARSGGIRPYDDSMGAARRYAAHFARGQRDADAFGRTHVGSAALQARIDHERRAQDLERRKADQEAGIRRREIDTSIADTAYKNAGTLDQENARGMWGTAAAAAGIAQEKLKTRGGIREARINAAGQLGEAKMKADSEKEIEALRQKHEKEMEELRTKLGIDAATATSLIQRSDAEWYAAQQARGSTGDGLVKGKWVNSPNGGRTLMYTQNDEMVDFDENKIPAPPNGLTQAGIDAWPLTGKKDDSTRKSHLKGLATGDDSYGLYYDRRKGRWLVLTINELRKEQSANLIPGLDHDAETYWTIVNAAKKEYADSGNKDSKKYSAR